MKKFFYGLYSSIIFFLFAAPVYAAGPDVTNYTDNTVQIITLIAAACAVFFIIKGGYTYMTSSGDPQALDFAKKTIRNAIIGLVLVLASNLIISIFQSSLTRPQNLTNTSAIALTPVAPQTPSDGLTQVLIDAINGFLQNLVQSATRPIVNAIFSYLTTTPSLLSNSVVFQFWLISVGIVDSLFVVVTALLGLQYMSASTFGFEELELRQILPRLGLAFLGANVSLFLCDYMITTCNALVREVLNSTGGLNQAWITNIINVSALTNVNQTTPLIILFFLIIFLLIAILLLFMYIIRLITIALAGALSPFIFLMWALPKFADFAEIAVKTYIVAVFMIFVQVVIIQLAASFLSVPNNNTNSLLSIVVAIGLFMTLLKVPGAMNQMMFYVGQAGMMKKIGGQIINTMTPSSSNNKPGTFHPNSDVKPPRRVVGA